MDGSEMQCDVRLRLMLSKSRMGLAVGIVVLVSYHELRVN